MGTNIDDIGTLI